jgi:hypothetical protein
MAELTLELMWEQEPLTMYRILKICRKIRELSKYILRRRVVDLNKLDEIHGLSMELDALWIQLRVTMNPNSKREYDPEECNELPEGPLEDIMLRIVEFVDHRDTFAPSELATVTVIKEYIDQIIQECEQSRTRSN